MKNIKRLLAIILSLAILICVLPMGAMTASAETKITDGYYTYTVVNGKATITDCSTDISGDVTIPSTLGGYTIEKID
ncbi:MAG: hypothetical protein Q4B40_02830 [Clostridia bacterium]|nr:hypothetical protein [Clostridia bacterium]